MRLQRTAPAVPHWGPWTTSEPTPSFAPLPQPISWGARRCRRCGFNLVAEGDAPGFFHQFGASAILYLLGLVAFAGAAAALAMGYALAALAALLLGLALIFVGYGRHGFTGFLLP